MEPPASLPPQLDLIAGEWVEPAQVRVDTTGAARWIERASDGAGAQQQRATDAAAVERALASADAVHRSGEWQATPVAERADRLEAMADELERRVPEVAVLESATTGAVIGVTTMLGFILHGAFRLAAAQLREGVLTRRFDGPTGIDVEVDRLGWGPALLLCPWNAPAPMAAHKAASALAAGCPVIVKPPERAPHGSAAIGHAAVAAGLAPGLVQVRPRRARGGGTASWPTGGSGPSASPVGSSADVPWPTPAPRASSPPSSSSAGTRRCWCSTTPIRTSWPRPRSDFSPR